MEQMLGKRKQAMSAEFDKLPEAVNAKAEIDELRKQSGEIRSQLQKLQSERLDKDQELAKMRAEYKETDEKRKALDRELRTEFEKRPVVVEERKAIGEQRKHPDKLERTKAADRDRALPPVAVTVVAPIVKSVAKLPPPSGAAINARFCVPPGLSPLTVKVRSSPLH